MKRILFFLMLLMSTLLQPAFAFVAMPPVQNDIKPKPIALPVKITVKDWEQATGKHLNFIQRLEWKLAQKRINKLSYPNGDITEKQRKLGKLSMTLGIAGLVLLFVPYIGIAGLGLGIAAFILGLKSVKGNSNTPGIIGLIAGSLTLLLTVAAVIAVAAFLSNWH